MVDSQTKLVLKALNGNLPGTIYPLNKENLKVGRYIAELNNPVEIDLGPQEEGGEVFSVSRYHADIYHLPDGWFVADRGSMNHTFINGEILEPQQLYLFKVGDILRFGLIELLVEEEG